jgi:tetratricopeptide (TPR) repeat protein
MRLTTFLLFFLLMNSKLFCFVFINSVPMKADVILNGKVIGKTPLLIREELNGPCKIGLKKDFYMDTELNLNISTKITNLYSFLPPTSFSIYFPQETDLIINNKKSKSDYIKNLPQGIYEFNPLSNSLSIKRVNPNKTFLYFSLGLGALGLGTGLISQLLANNSYSAYQASKSFDEATNNLSSVTFFDSLSRAGYILGCAGTGLSVYFFIDDMLYNSRNQEIILKDNNSVPEDKDLYEKAMDYLSRLDNTNALAFFNQLIEKYPDSQYMPISLLRRASIYKGFAQYETALKDLKKLQLEFPIYEIYEVTLKTLADVEFLNGDFADAAVVYDDAVHFAKAFKPYELGYESLKALSKNYQQSKDGTSKARLSEAIRRFTDNPLYPEEFKRKAQELSSGI